MNVSKLMSRDVRCCHPNDSLQRVAAAMWDGAVGALPVADLANHVIGMITDRDALMAAYTRGGPLSDIPASIAMSPRVHSVRESDSVDVADKLMQRHQVRRVPVVDDAGRIVGIVSLDDLARATLAPPKDAVSADQVALALLAVGWPRNAAPPSGRRLRSEGAPASARTGSATPEVKMKVRELMTKDVLSCTESEPINRAAQIMWDSDCGCVPVVDADRQVIGIITDRDALMAAYTTGKPLSDIPVSTAMSRQVFTTRPEDALDVAEALMQRHRVRRLPVTDLAGRLVGLLSLNDIARALRRAGPHDEGVGAARIAATFAAVCAPAKGAGTTPTRGDKHGAQAPV